jgi:hypothetical protein
MAIDLVVQRGDGANPGEDIVDTLITEISVALSRGQVEIDRVAKRAPITLQVKYRPGVKTGQLVEVVDALMGAAWRGKVVSVEHGVDGPVLMTTLQVMKYV